MRRSTYRLTCALSIRFAFRASSSELTSTLFTTNQHATAPAVTANATAPATSSARRERSGSAR